jgi:hypothetical protein
VWVVDVVVGVVVVVLLLLLLLLALGGWLGCCCCRCAALPGAHVTSAQAHALEPHNELLYLKSVLVLL